MIDLQQAIFGTQVLTALAVTLQNLEFFFLRRRLSSYRIFDFWLALRFFSAISLLFLLHPWFVLALLIASLALYRSLQGPFNGGSDSMTVTLIASLFLISIDPQSTFIPRMALGFVGIQTCLSYFLAGIAKIRVSAWRNGSALPLFLQMGIYRAPFFEKISRSKTWSLWITWGILVFELSFPLALFDVKLGVLYMGLGFCFHLLNVRVFGLNRFLWIWAATYPALFYCGSLLR